MSESAIIFGPDAQQTLIEFKPTYLVPRPGDVVDFCQTRLSYEADGTVTSYVTKTLVLVFDVDDYNNPVSNLDLRFFRRLDDVQKSVPHLLFRSDSPGWWEWPLPREYKPLPAPPSPPT